mgnify:CR=1 FL=1|tara:strand:- start:3395 stop:3865 length:471 start_codon:yes stop_codon:yes gene_type:complete
MLYYRNIKYVNALQLIHLQKPETIILQRELNKLNKQDLIYNVLISDYLVESEKQKRKKLENEIIKLKAINELNYGNKNNNNIKKNNKQNLNKTYSNNTSKDYKISENQTLTNYLYEINKHNKTINDNINSKNKFYTKDNNNFSIKSNNRFSVLADL